MGFEKFRAGTKVKVGPDSGVIVDRREELRVEIDIEFDGGRQQTYWSHGGGSAFSLCRVGLDKCEDNQGE